MLTLLSFSAGIILPSASVILRQNRVDGLSREIGLLCREVFHRSVASGLVMRVGFNSKGLLAAFVDDNGILKEKSDIFLQAVSVDKKIRLIWPENGWAVIPEGYCESPVIRIIDNETGESISFKFRPYDARFEEIALGDD